jgi:hypothetical protein
MSPFGYKVAHSAHVIGSFEFSHPISIWTGLVRYADASLC